MITEDSELDADACVGTFRWKASKKFASLSSLGTGEYPQQGVDLSGGWAQYLMTRLGSVESVERCRSDLSIIDALSFPLSALYALTQLGINKANLNRLGKRELNLVVMGATYKAEVRIWKETEYWKEIEQALLVNVKLWFIGPEVTRVSVNDKEHDCMFKGGCKSFFAENPHLLDNSGPSLTVLIGFNPGFGSGNAQLLESWLHDLEFIVDTNIPCIFTQANDYSDLRGELVVLRSLLQVNFILQPQRCPFHMALTTCADASDPTSSTWACGNSFFYGFQGGRERLPVADKKRNVCVQLLAKFFHDVNGYSVVDAAVLASEEIKPFELHKLPSTSNDSASLWDLE